LKLPAIPHESLVDTLLLALRKHPGCRIGWTSSARAIRSRIPIAQIPTRCSMPNGPLIDIGKNHRRDDDPRINRPP